MARLTIVRELPIRGAPRAALRAMAPLIAAWTMVGAAGCGAGRPGGPGSPVAMSALDLPGARQTALAKLAQSDNGLVLRKWMILDDADLIAAAMGAHADEWSLDGAVKESLRRNGLRMIRVSLGELDALLTELGGASLDLTGWQGQAYEWCAILERKVDSGGQALAVDGKVRRYDGGSIRLMARGWTLPTEDGPRLQLQIVPLYHPQQQEIVGSFMPRLGSGSLREEVFGSMALELELEAGWAYVLTCESPERQWALRSGGGADGVSSSSAGAAGPGPGAPSRRTGAGRDEPAGLGPKAPPPTTAGELMLRSESHPASRGMLLFVARIPAGLVPAEGGGETATSARGGEPMPAPAPEQARKEKGSG